MVNKLYNYNDNLYNSCVPLKAPPSPAAHQNIALLVCIQGTESDKEQIEYQVQETFR